MDEVWPGLFVGDLSSLSNLADTDIVNLITVELKSSGTLAKCRMMHVEVSDECSSDLLSFWPMTNKFIEEALDRKERVLVHCVHGVSRSAATAAAFILKVRGGPVSDVLTLMRSVRPCVCPNEGFLSQLELFNQMNCDLSRPHPAFRLYSILNNIPGEENCLGEDLKSCLRCRSCRLPLASKQSIVSHQRGENVTWESLVKSHETRNKRNSNLSTVKSRVFRELREEMDFSKCRLSVFVARFDERFHAQNGRILCPNCKQKLGHWATNCVAAKCGCGGSIWPGWTLTRSKVDAVIF